MPPILLPLPGNEALAENLATGLGARSGKLAVRRFPDGESYVRIDSPVRDAEVILVCTLDRPDEKLLPLYFAASTARDLGAARVGLVAPYLAYMRQDQRFQPGEAITSTCFARLLSGCVDWLVTVDPHLHRRHDLGEIYPVPNRSVPAASAVASWIRGHVDHAVLIGPDAESAQWVEAVAAAAGVPFRVLEKVRRGDRNVQVSLPDLRGLTERTPVLVDDIISTGRTMIEAVRQLRRVASTPPVCVGVHAVFAGNAYPDLVAAGAGQVVTCNTIAHPSNQIDVAALLAEAVRDLEPTWK